MTSMIIGRLFHCFCFCIYHLPKPVQKVIGICIGILWFDVLRIRRKAALENIARVYPEMPKSAATQLARQSLIHMGYTVVEICSFPFLTSQSIDRMFTYHGEEHLKEAIAKNTGVFLLSAHIGNGDLAVASLASRGYPIHLISKVFKTKWLNDFWFKARREQGCEFIEPRKSTYEILKALKNNQVVVFVLDQYTGPPNGIRTQFFGIETGTAVGPALFTQRSGAQVVSGFCYRKDYGKYVIELGPAIPFVEQATKEETLTYNTEQYNRVIEKAILAHPEQWMWIHRRWKVGWTD